MATLLTRYRCPNDREHVIAVLASYGRGTLRIACETCETEMVREGFANVPVPSEKVPALLASGGTNQLPTM